MELDLHKQCLNDEPHSLTASVSQTHSTTLDISIGYCNHAVLRWLYQEGSTVCIWIGDPDSAIASPNSLWSIHVNHSMAERAKREMISNSGPEDYWLKPLVQLLGTIPDSTFAMHHMDVPWDVRTEISKLHTLFLTTNQSANQCHLLSPPIDSTVWVQNG